jgi:hypothetical protein
LLNVPIRDYEDLKSYVEKWLTGREYSMEEPLFCKTSEPLLEQNTFPLTKESMPYHIEAARNAILHYIRNWKY